MLALYMDFFILFIGGFKLLNLNYSYTMIQNMKANYKEYNQYEQKQ